MKKFIFVLMLFISLATYGQPNRYRGLRPNAVTATLVPVNMTYGVTYSRLFCVMSREENRDFGLYGSAAYTPEYCPFHGYHFQLAGGVMMPLARMLNSPFHTSVTLGGSYNKYEGDPYLYESTFLGRPGSMEAGVALQFPRWMLTMKWDVMNQYMKVGFGPVF